VSATGPAVRSVAAAHWRTRWRGLLVLGLLLGLVGGTVLAAGALGARTGTAHSRLVEAVHLDDARVMPPADHPELVAAIPTMPGVASSWVTSSWVAQVDGPMVRYVSLGAGTDPPPDLVTPVVVDGRAPAPDAVDEVLVGEPLAAMGGFAVGDEMTLRLLTTADVAAFDVGFGEPGGSVVRVRVVGIARMPAWGGALSNMLAGPAFAAAHGAEAVAHPAFVRLADDPRAAEVFSAAYRATSAGQPASAVAQYLPPFVEMPRSAVDPAVRTAERVLTAGLAVFAVVLAAGGLLVVGQALVRLHGTGRAAQQVESALGLTVSERVAARVLAASPAAALAASVGGALAVAGGVLEPIGSQSRFEPTPGFRPDWPVAVGGAVLLATVFLLLTATAVVLVGIPRAGGATVAGRAAWGRRGPAIAVGLGLVRRGGPAGVATLVGAGLVVAGVVAAATFGAGVQRLVDTPARYGEAADLTLVDAREPDLTAIAADPRVTGLDVISTADVSIAGEQVEASAREQRVGAIPVAVAAGRPAQRSGEVALGPRFAARQGVAVGETVAARRPDGTAVPLVVTGLVVLRSESVGTLGEVAQLAPAQLAELAAAEPLVAADIDAVDGAEAALFGELSQRLEIFERETPDAVRNLADIVALPELLALVLALVGGAGMVHAVQSAARRHAPDLAVMAVLGATPRQVCAAVGVLAAGTVVPALLLGVPLGLLVARVLWAEVAVSTGVAGDPALPGALLVAIGPVVLLGALLAAALPAWRAARTPPAAVLRGE
jgi:putative ABC transport system permease protein